MNTQGNFDFAKELRSVIDEFSPDRFLLGEVFGKQETIKKFLGQNHDGLNLIFLFETIEFQFKAQYFKNIIQKFEKAYPSPFTPVYVFGNHDQKRYIAKLKNNIQKAKLLALIQFTVRGVPVTYYGEEIGMHEAEIPFHKAKDPLAQNYKHIPKFLTDLLGIYINRDGCRTPMQWSSEENAGFTQGKTPWLEIPPNASHIHVENQKRQENSLWNTYKALLHVRNKSSALKKGTLELIEFHKHILAYKRKWENEEYLILCNFSKHPIHLKPISMQSPLFSTYGDQDSHALRPFEGIILSQNL